MLQPKTYTLLLGPLRSLSRVGIHPLERKIGRVLEVTVELKVELPPNFNYNTEDFANRSADVAIMPIQIPDYSKLTDDLRAILKESYPLIEDYGAQMIESILTNFPDVGHILVKVEKRNPLTGGQLDAASVTLAWPEDKVNEPRQLQ